MIPSPMFWFFLIIGNEATFTDIVLQPIGQKDPEPLSHQAGPTRAASVFVVGVVASCQTQ